jgi:membrane protein required for colicin V production
MNAFDIVVAVILGYGLIRGIFRGLVKEVASIAGVLGGLFAAYMFHPAAAGALARFIANPAYRNILGFLLIFCAVLIAVNLAAIVVKYLMKIVFLGWLDRLGGLALGLAKGVLIVAVLFLALTAFLPKNTPVIQQSVCAPYAALVSERLAAAASGDFRRDFLAKLAELRKAWKIPN